MYFGVFKISKGAEASELEFVGSGSEGGSERKIFLLLITGCRVWAWRGFRVVMLSGTKHWKTTPKAPVRKLCVF